MGWRKCGQSICWLTMSGYTSIPIVRISAAILSTCLRQGISKTTWWHTRECPRILIRDARWTRVDLVILLPTFSNPNISTWDQIPDKPYGWPKNRLIVSVLGRRVNSNCSRADMFLLRTNAEGCSDSACPHDSHPLDRIEIQTLSATRLPWLDTNCIILMGSLEDRNIA